MFGAGAGAVDPSLVVSAVVVSKLSAVASRQAGVAVLVRLPAVVPAGTPAGQTEMVSKARPKSASP